jgi:hypothetical protein
VDRAALVDRVVDRDLLRAELDPDSARALDLALDLVALRVRADYCLGRARLPRDVPQAVLRPVAAATSVTRRPRKAR